VNVKSNDLMLSLTSPAFEKHEQDTHIRKLYLKIHSYMIFFESCTLKW